MITDGHQNLIKYLFDVESWLRYNDHRELDIDAHFIEQCFWDGTTVEKCGKQIMAQHEEAKV